MDKLLSDIDYFTHRLADAERLVLGAATAPARLAYAELARLYRERVALLRGTPDDGGGSEAETLEMEADGSPPASLIAFREAGVSDVGNEPPQGAEAEKIAVFAKRLSHQFGENTISVVRRQIADAEHGEADAWNAILAHLLDKQGLHE